MGEPTSAQLSPPRLCPGPRLRPGALGASCRLPRSSVSPPTTGSTATALLASLCPVLSTLAWRLARDCTGRWPSPPGIALGRRGGGSGGRGGVLRALRCLLCPNTSWASWKEDRPWPGLEPRGHQKPSPLPVESETRHCCPRASTHEDTRDTSPGPSPSPHWHQTQRHSPECRRRRPGWGRSCAMCKLCHCRLVPGTPAARGAVGAEREEVPHALQAGTW